MSEMFDDAVVGAGIIGLATAYQLARRGRKVVVLEKNERACGASIRNFGMLWPIGQPAGEMLKLATVSLKFWREILRESGLWFDPVGSLHLAHNEDEAQILCEFAEGAGELGYGCKLVDPAEVYKFSEHINTEGLKIALWSGTEVCIDPRQVLSELPAWLSENFDITFRFGCQVRGFNAPIVVTSTGEQTAHRFWICSGDDFQSLHPEIFVDSELVRCKLQMMRTRSSHGSFRLGPMLAGGLTLRHYQAFNRCPSINSLRERISRTMPEFDKYGIHVMVAQNGAGELVIGDSHEYGSDIWPFDNCHIDELILSYLSEFFCNPKLPILQRWHGTYAKHRSDSYFIRRISPETTVLTGLGGAGMTLSFGIADKCVKEIL